MSALSPNGRQCVNDLILDDDKRLAYNGHMLTPDQIAQFHRDGFLVIPGFKNAEEIASLRRRAEQIVDEFDPASTRSVFSTVEQEKTTDDYFLRSDNTIKCFFEEEAFDANGQLKQAKALSINKIGHAMHDLDPVFQSFSRDPRLAQVARDVGLADPKVWQSMYIFKQPGIGGEVRWHQDATYFETTPISVTTFWFALEDATRDNGCLWAEPGGHRGPMRERFIRNGDDVRMETLSDMPWPDDSTAVPLECKAGSLVVFHGLLPHYSAPNRSPVSRHAYTLHATDGNTEYSPQNWIQRDAAFPARGFI
jgi:phytanoyl-CoA hydroxylase